MVNIEDLTGISESKRKEVISCLDKLLIHRSNKNRPIPFIKGYNFYDKLSSTDSSVTFSHLHETEKYKQDILEDLVSSGYNK